MYLDVNTPLHEAFSGAKTSTVMGWKSGNSFLPSSYSGGMAYSLCSFNRDLSTRLKEISKDPPKNLSSLYQTTWLTSKKSWPHLRPSPSFIYLQSSKCVVHCTFSHCCLSSLNLFWYYVSRSLQNMSYYYYVSSSTLSLSLKWVSTNFEEVSEDDCPFDLH